MIMTNLAWRLLFLLCLCSQNSIFGSTQQLIDELTRLKISLETLSKTIGKPIKIEEPWKAETRKKLAEEVNAKKLKESISENIKQYDFKALDKNMVQAFIDHFVNKPIEIKESSSGWYDYDLSFSDIDFLSCSCPNMNMTNRILLTLCQLNAINQKYPNKTNTFVHTSIGAGQLLQTYMLAYGLLITGYKKITFCCIDDYELGLYKPTGPTDKGFDFKKAQEQFIILAKKYPPASINFIDFKNVYSYIEATNTGAAPKSHAFDSIDPDGGLPAFIPGTKAKIKTEKYSLIIFTQKADTETQAHTYSNPSGGFKAPKKLDSFYLYMEHLYDKKSKKWSVRPYFFRNDLYLKTDSEKQQQEDTLNNLKKLETKSYANISELLQEVTPILNKYDPSLEPQPFFYQPFDFKALVEYARVDDNPIIFEGDTNLLEQSNPQRIWEQTLDSVRKKFDPRGAWIPVMDPMGKIGRAVVMEPGPTPSILYGTKFTRPYQLN